MHLHDVHCRATCDIVQTRCKPVVALHMLQAPLPGQQSLSVGMWTCNLLLRSPPPKNTGLCVCIGFGTQIENEFELVSLLTLPGIQSVGALAADRDTDDPPWLLPAGQHHMVSATSAAT
jgi:hypothetical protein